jgi:DNA-binding NarL/FixJ family response regulator
VAAGGTALDPEVVTQLLGASRRNDALTTLTPRERDVLAVLRYLGSWPARPS